MRRQPVLWLTISILCFVAGIYFWKWGEKRAGRGPGATPPPAVAQEARTNTVRLLSLDGNLNAASVPRRSEVETNRSARLAYRLSNTPEKIGQLTRNPKAVLLENALIDTTRPLDFDIPAHLRATGEPAAWIVQAHGPLDNSFRALLKSSGAEIVAYIPNNAYLVTASADVARTLAGKAQSVLPYEPYYKLKAGLLQAASQMLELPEDTRLRVLLFPNQGENTLAALEETGAEILGQTRSPFGTVVEVRPEPTSLPALAKIPGVQVIERLEQRVPANDLSRVRLGVATNSTIAPNYLGLTGTNVLVNLNDTGVDISHPDLATRAMADGTNTAVDVDGHGTHVAGIIASSGGQSGTVSNAIGSFRVNGAYVDGQFRGKAPGASLFSMHFLSPDVYLQETAARTNAFISNNSWQYRNTHEYDLASASYDAAVRDALPEDPGSQPLLFVFASGNSGGGDSNGSGGRGDSVVSPATAKNVITVGALEQFREITNETYLCGTDPSLPPGEIFCETNAPWAGGTDSDNEVAGFSSRGNVGVSIEGESGRFKPDLVAPGTFVISTRSGQWDTNAYYSSTSHVSSVYLDRLVEPGTLWRDMIFIPENAVEVTIEVFPSQESPIPFPNDLPIYISRSGVPTNTPGGYDFVRNNQVVLPRDYPIDPRNESLFYAIGNNSSNAIFVGVRSVIVLTNDNGNYFEVLQRINDDLGPYYRYESGSSMAAPQVSGMLALMQEFFEQRLGKTNSPALMKALLINGARATGSDLYDFGVDTVLNLQGWGVVNLTNTLPASWTNLTAEAGAPKLVFDQSPEDALATGQSRTHNVAVEPTAANAPLRVTLVWTDPPGNPAASIKLVNDLDLVVTNLDTGEVFFGNDIAVGNDFNGSWDTNTAPNLDVVNNVENVYLNSPLGTNYSVTVIGRHVNVNAVTAHPNDVVQDYALVISAGNGVISNALRVVETTTVSETIPFVTAITNAFVDNPDISGNVLLGQHVGANTPLQGTNQIAAPVANGVITLGMTNQWHFYAITNEFGFTNAAFMTFIPPTLAVPRKGAVDFDLNNATRIEADIDLYVTTEPGLTNLAPDVLERASKSLGRLGSETIILSNATQSVYYIGVKAEDQQAAEYALVAVFSLEPFSSEDAMGNQYLRGFPVPQVIPDARLDAVNKIQPGRARIFAFSTGPELVRRVVVTNVVSHELMGDLTGTLVHGRDSVTLNNHTTNAPVVNEMFVYDDSGEMDISGSIQSDGPGTLENFAGKEGAGQWLFTQADGAVAHVGTNGMFRIFLEKQQDLEDGIIATILPGACRSDFVRVPAEATNLTIELAILQGTGPISLQVCPLEQIAGCESTIISNSVGGSVTIDIYDNPPLQQGVYRVRTCNLGTEPVTVRILARIFRGTVTAQTLTQSSGPVTLKDDAITYAYITNLANMRISSLDVGLLFNHPRISDLAITLISPDGTRILLFEDRGGLTAGGMGSITSTTNGLGQVTYFSSRMVPFYRTSFESAPLGLYAPGSIPEGWNVLTNFVGILPDWSLPWQSNRVLSLEDGIVSHQLPGNGSGQYELVWKASHAPYLTGTVGWWPFEGDGKDIFGGLDGLLMGGGNTTNYAMFLPGKVGGAFFGDSVRASMVVPAVQELDVANGGFTVEGWIYPSNLLSAAPLVEWAERTNNTPGVQFWVSGLSWTNQQPGVLAAAFPGSNGVAQVAMTTTNAITNGGWQHVALTYNPASREARIYANGQLAASQAVPVGIDPVTTGDLYFGFHPADATNVAAFRGGLDEFGLYRRALTECEIGAIYNAGAMGKHGTNVLTCPVSYEVTLQTDTGSTAYYFTNGLSWATNGLSWELNSISFSNAVAESSGTNGVNLTIRPLSPNVALDDFVLYGLTNLVINGSMNFTENTNLALVPIKFAPTPYSLISTSPPVLVFSNNFETAIPGVHTNGSILPGARDWVVTQGAVTVLSNRLINPAGTNALILGLGRVETTLPTIPGRRYELSYNVRGPGAVGWWNGDLEPLSGRLRDLIGGNHGAFIHGATNVDAGFVIHPGGPDNALLFPANEFIPTNPFPNVAYSPRVELSDPPNLRLTNALSIEGWIYPRNTTTNFTGVGTYMQQIFYRGDGRDCLDPYYLALYYDEPNERYDIVFHVEDATGRNCGFELFSTNMPVVPDRWQHVAAVFDSNIPVPGSNGTNGQPALTNALRIYLDGALIGEAYTSIAPFATLDSSYTPGVSIGNRSRYSRLTETFTDAQPFHGLIDDLAVYGRALTDTEVRDIYDLNVFGKSDPTAAPSQRLAKVVATVEGVQVDMANGENGQFTTRTISFTANGTNALVSLTGLLPGTIIGEIALVEKPAELSYLPEEKLSDLIGENTYGVWTLEIYDTRAGANSSTEPIQLIDWRLDFRMTPVSPPPVIELAHGITYRNILLPGQSQYFVVPVPQWASYATNALLWATNRWTGEVSEVGVLYSPTNPAPATLDNALVWPPASSSLTVLSTNTTPQYIVPGQRYFLTVTNATASAVTYEYGVWFDIIPLTNCQPITALARPAGIPTYYQIDVPAEGDGSLPRELVLSVTGARSNLVLVASQTLPLPELGRYDYISRVPGGSDQAIMVLTNNTPYPLGQGRRWYAGVYNTLATDVAYTIQACYSSSVTNSPLIIPLTNSVPFIASATNEFAAPPGPPQWMFFEFNLTNSVEAVLFELYGLSGNADLILQREVPSGMAPYFDGSFQLGNKPESIVVRLGRELGDLRGKWYAGIYNNESTNVGYTIRVTTPDQSGLLNTALPLMLTMYPAAGPHGITLQWNSIPGEIYVVEFSPTVFPPVWQELAIAQPIMATTTLTAIELPIGSTGKGFYRVRHDARGPVLIPPMSVRIEPDGRIRLSWPQSYTGLIVQSTSSLNNWMWSNANLTIVAEGDEWVAYDDIGNGQKFYRLVAE